MIRVILEHLNEQIRRDKSGRKEAGLTLHKRDVPRSLYTSIGELTWERDYYRHGESGSYRYLLDEAVGVISYQRVGDTVSADLLNRAAMVSYAKSIDIVTGGKISRQTVRNKLLRVKVPEPEVVTEKKRMKELHVYADRIIDDLCRGTWDWSVFEREPFMFDGTSGTQILIKGLGQRRNILN